MCYVSALVLIPILLISLVSATNIKYMISANIGSVWFINLSKLMSQKFVSYYLTKHHLIRSSVYVPNNLFND